MIPFLKAAYFYFKRFFISSVSNCTNVNFYSFQWERFELFQIKAVDFWKAI